MIREISHKNVKAKSRQKSKNSSRASQSKVHPQPRPTKVQITANHRASGVGSPFGSGSRGKIQRNNVEKCKEKGLNHQKLESDAHAIFMKGNLRQLMSKNLAPKPKTNEVVPQLLKNIQKHCKQLKKIHQQERCYHKRVSLQENKLSKDKRLLSNKSQDHPSKKKEIPSEKVPKREKTPKQVLKATKGELKEKGAQHMENRFSLEIRAGQEDPMTNERLCRRPVENQENDKNFIELFKIYKKSFEIEDVKIEKSNKNTNYNTNQSKNSSSIFNSAHGDLTNRNKPRAEDKINLYKIQNLIRSQQRSVSKDNSSEDLRPSEEDPKPTVRKFADDTHKYSSGGPSQQNSAEKKQSNESLNIQDVEDRNLDIYEPAEMRQCLISMQRSPERENPNVGNGEAGISKKGSEIRGHEPRSEEELKEKKFESSKFYVKPVPALRMRRKGDNNLEEDSLVGCEITLIENNVVCEDSELMSLEL